MRNKLLLLLALTPSAALADCERVNVSKDSVSQCVDVFIGDSSVTTGAGKTGLAYNTASLTAYYHRGSASSATEITLADTTLGTWSEGAFKEVSSTNAPGLYQFCPPDAAFETGASNVTFILKGAANMRPVCLAVTLDSSFDPDGTAQGGTSTTIQLAATSSNVNDFYNYNTVVAIQKGTGMGQARCITDYIGASYTATVPQWTTTPDATSQYVLVAQPSCQLERLLDAVTEAEGSLTVRQVLSLTSAVLFGRTSNGGLTFKTPNGNATRVTATVDTSKNRTAITLNPSN